MRSLIPIVEIANSVCEEVGDITYKHQRIILKHLARCYQDLHLYLTPTTTIKTDVFAINNVIEMPSDFVYETKVGIKYGDKVKLIGKNYDVVGNGILDNMNHSEFEDYVIDPIGLDIDESFTPFYNYQGNLVLKAYGLGGKCSGLYTVDTARGQIHLGSSFPRGHELVVEYKSDGVSDGLDLVPTEMESCLFNFGLWKHYFRRNDPRYRQSEEDYDVARYKLETLYSFQPISYLSKLYGSFEKGSINDDI